ncbi:MAG: ATP-binding protein [Lachnospiraceae bacterium]|nr:ATP-binding protein [Lachnospiraceae bacterium]
MSFSLKNGNNGKYGVKVLTGVRRCGKSTVLKMIMEKLQQEHGVPSERIVSMCFDSMDYEDMTAKDMFKAVKEKLNPTGRTYLFLDEVYTIVRDIYNSTIFSDIVKRNQIRKIDQLERVVRYTFANVGNSFSAKSISDYLKSEHRSIDNETVYSYLEKLEKAYLLHRCSRYDLRGKEILKTQEKFYLADTALRYSVLGYTPDSVASSLENVVYLELCRRGYTVTIGKMPDGVVDFVAQKQNDRLYVQVTQEIKSEKTEKREYERLLEIRDNYPKYVLRTDEFAGGNYQGIKSMHIADFLLSTEY